MVQTLCFHKVIVLSEQSQNFSRENIHESLKSLFKGSGRIATDMIQEYFEEIEINSFNIKYEQILLINNNFDNEIKRIFHEKESSLFLVDENIWNIIQKIIDQLIMNLYNPEENIKHSIRLQKIAEICRDYNLLLEIYKMKL